MELTLKTNRMGIIKFLMPIFAILSVFFTLMVIAYITHYEDMKEQTFAGITISALEFLFVVGFIVTKLIRRKTYTFTLDKIAVCRKNKQVNQISIDDIVYMKYVKFHFRYFLTIFTGELRDGGCWKLYVYLTNGNKITLDMFDDKDIKKIKELYGELVQIT